MEALRIISEEHRNLWRLATTIDLVADELDQGTQVDPAFFTSVFDYIENFIDRSHHPKEDDFLFRLLRRRSAEAGAIIDRLQADHRAESEKLAAHLTEAYDELDRLRLRNTPAHAPDTGQGFPATMPLGDL